MQGARARILYRRSNGQSLSIHDDNLLGSGGEGSIYTLDDLPDLVAKVYHSPSGTIGAKLALMVDNPPTMTERDGHVSIAWPLDTLHSALPARANNTAGFLMHKIVSMKEVTSAYNPAARKRSFPHYTYAHLCAVAINIATVVNVVHGRNYVIGDINESNIMVNANGLVTLIDTDSFQVIDLSDGTVHRSPVGKPEYTPQELQGHSFDAVDRNQYHDRFGLGVIIFQLLLEGRHPYIGKYTGRGEPPAIEDNIARGNFIHSESRTVPLVDGSGYMPWETLGEPVRDLFGLCFETGHDNQIVRPTAHQWEEELTRAFGSLVTCSQSPHHVCFAHNPYCPWCERMNMRGQDPFSGRSGPEPLLMRTGADANQYAVSAGPTGQSPALISPNAQPASQLPTQITSRRWHMPSNRRQAWAALLLIVGLLSFVIWGVSGIVEYFGSNPIGPFGSDVPASVAGVGDSAPSLSVSPASIPVPALAVATSTPTETPTATPTIEPSPTATVSPPTSTAVPIVAYVENTPTPYPIQPTYTPLPTSTPRPVPTSLPTSTPSPTAIPTPTPLPTATFTATPTAAPLPTATHTPTPEPTPTLVPTSTSTPVPILPDLVVGPVSSLPDSPAIWEEVPFTASVSNQGTASAAEFTVGLYDGDDVLDERTVGGLASDTAREVTLIWRAEVAPRPLSIVVDRDNRIAESDEQNNTRPVPSMEAPAVTHKVDSVTWHPAKPEIGEPVTFWAYVANISEVAEESDVGVAFYIDGEYHSWSRLQSVETAAADQIASDSWEAQKGSHEVTAVLYPTGFFNYSSKSSWREFNHRYAVAIGRVSYDHTRLPNLAVTDVEFSQENVAGTDTFYLDTRVTVLNMIGDDGLRPPPVTNSFDVRIEFKTSLPCPLAVAPCEATLRINGLDRGAGVTRSVEGTVPLPLPRAGRVHEFLVVVTVDPLDDVDESDESDNTTEITGRVANN